MLVLQFQLIRHVISMSISRTKIINNCHCECKTASKRCQFLIIYTVKIESHESLNIKEITCNYGIYV